MANQPKSANYALATSMFAIIAFILMWVGSIRCNFIKFVDTSGTSQPISREFGLWYYQYWATIFTTDGTYIVRTCHLYPDGLEFDASWKAARAFSILAFIFAFIIMFLKCAVSCATDPRQAASGSGPIVPPLYLVTSIFQGLTLLFLNSKACKDNALVEWGTAVVFPDTCSISTGAKCIISATVFWAAAALASFGEQKALKEEQATNDHASLSEPLFP